MVQPFDTLPFVANRFIYLFIYLFIYCLCFWPVSTKLDT